MIIMIIGLCLLLIVVTILVVSYICYRQAFYNDEKKVDLNTFPIKVDKNISLEYIHELVNDLYNEPYEDVSIKSYDGMMLNARYYHRKDNAPIEIVFHGYKSVGYKDFCGGNKISKKLEHNVLLVEQRGHGKSKSNKICFGTKEKFDCIEWIKYVNNRFCNNCDILLVGVSMGAATVLMASGLKLPKNVKGIIADCPYSSPKDIVLKVCRDRKYPVLIVYPFLVVAARVFAKFNFISPGAEELVKKSETPILIIHGKEDDFVPVFMSERIYKNCNSYKELHLFEGANHATSFLIDEEKYSKIVSDFCQKVL